MKMFVCSSSAFHFISFFLSALLFLKKKGKSSHQSYELYVVDFIVLPFVTYFRISGIRLLRLHHVPVISKFKPWRMIASIFKYRLKGILNLSLNLEDVWVWCDVSSVKSWCFIYIHSCPLELPLLVYACFHTLVWRIWNVL